MNNYEQVALNNANSKLGRTWLGSAQVLVAVSGGMCDRTFRGSEDVIFIYYEQVALKINVLNKYEQVAHNKDKVIFFKYLTSSTGNQYCIVGLQA